MNLALPKILTYMKQKSTGTHKTTIIGTQENTENG